MTQLLLIGGAGLVAFCYLLMFALCRAAAQRDPPDRAPSGDEGVGMSEPQGNNEPPFDCDIFRCTERAEWAIIGESGDVYVCAEHYETQTSPRTRPRWQRIGHAE